jgi:outer membrane lipoprotein-sorting protein
LKEFFKYSIFNRKYLIINLIQARRNRQFLALVLMVAFFLSACCSLVARVSEKPEDLKATPEARELLALLQHQNLTLRTFKGTGTITFRNNEKKLPAIRAVWIGSIPGKLRIALCSLSGQPTVSFASDGQWFYLFSHADSQFYKQPATIDTLKKFFSISITFEDIVSILAGRIALNQCNHAVAEKHESQSGYVLTLKKRSGTICERVYFNENKTDVNGVEVFDLNGALVYRVEFCGMQTIKNYQVPACVVFWNEEGRGFQLDIDRYWADVSISSSAFVLAPPE